MSSFGPARRTFVPYDQRAATPYVEVRRLRDEVHRLRAQIRTLELENEQLTGELQDARRT